ncbi:hypothetical protein PM082_020860 [Marasmius tenuissimus]|nr:hypothetical protein PM082_020860 [Marasmius tenuissimus]
MLASKALGSEAEDLQPESDGPEINRLFTRCIDSCLPISEPTWDLLNDLRRIDLAVSFLRDMMGGGDMLGLGCLSQRLVPWVQSYLDEEWDAVDLAEYV